MQDAAVSVQPAHFSETEAKDVPPFSGLSPIVSRFLEELLNSNSFKELLTAYLADFADDLKHTLLDKLQEEVVEQFDPEDIVRNAIDQSDFSSMLTDELADRLNNIARSL